MRVIAIIPAYNESSQIAHVVSSVRPHVDEVVVIDDGSRDNTAQFAKDSGVTVLRHIINRGQGAALQTGMDYARSRADIIVHFDADGQHPAYQINELINPIKVGEYDIVLSSRFLDDTSNTPRSRKWVLKAGLLFTRAMSGLRISDPHSGFRAIHSSAIPKLVLQQDRMAHASELLQLVSRHKLRYKEIAVTIKYTEYSMAKGQTSLSAFRILIDLIKGTLL